LDAGPAFLPLSVCGCKPRSPLRPC
jgi:hypothetical protein